MEITFAIPTLGRCEDPASPSFLKWVMCGQSQWEHLERGTPLDFQLLEAAWLLSVLCQQGMAKLLGFAPGQQAAMP